MFKISTYLAFIEEKMEELGGYGLHFTGNLKGESELFENTIDTEFKIPLYGTYIEFKTMFRKSDYYSVLIIIMDAHGIVDNWNTNYRFPLEDSFDIFLSKLNETMNVDYAAFTAKSKELEKYYKAVEKMLNSN